MNISWYTVSIIIIYPQACILQTQTNEIYSLSSDIFVEPPLIAFHLWDIFYIFTLLCLLSLQFHAFPFQGCHLYIIDGIFIMFYKQSSAHFQQVIHYAINVCWKAQTEIYRKHFWWTDPLSFSWLYWMAIVLFSRKDLCFQSHESNNF